MKQLVVILFVVLLHPRFGQAEIGDSATDHIANSTTAQPVDAGTEDIDPGKGAGSQEKPAGRASQADSSLPDQPLPEAGDGSKKSIYEMSIEELLTLNAVEVLDAPIITATGIAEGKASAPANVVSYSRAEIAARGWRSLAEVLANVPGLYVIPDLVQPSIGVRGVSGGLRAGTRIVKVMIDGVAVHFRPDLTAAIGPEFIPLEAVERIEVAKGPLSALYGANAFLATVNVITRSGYSREALVASRLHLTRSRLGAGISGMINVGDEHRSLLLAFSADQLDRSGLMIEKTFPAQDDSLARYRPFFQGASRDDFAAPRGLFAKAFYELPLVGDLTLEGGYQHSDARAEFLTNSVLTHRSRITIDNWWANLHWRRQLHDTLSTSASLGWGQGYPGEDSQLWLTNSLSSYFTPRFNYRAVTADLRADLKLGDWLTVRLGVDGEYDLERVLYYRQTFMHAQGQYAAGDSADQIGVNDRREEAISDLGLHAQISSAPIPDLPGLRLFGNLRFDKLAYGATDFPWLLSWRAAVVQQWSEELTIKLIAGEAFQTPSGVLMFAQPGFGFGNRLVGNTTLQSVGIAPLREQSVRSVEAVISAALFGDLALQGGTYYQELHNKIEFIQSATDFVATNRTGVTRLIGADLLVRWIGWLSPYLCGSIVEDLGGEEDQGIPLYAKQQGTLGVDVNARPWSLVGNLQGRWVAPRRASQSNVLLNNDSPYDLPSYWTVDAALTTTGLHLFSDTSETRFRVAATNLLDRRYSEPGFSGFDVPALGRSVFIEVSQAY